MLCSFFDCRRVCCCVPFFQHIGGAHNYSSVSAAKAAIANVGREIQYGLMPKSEQPFVFVFTGNGNVSQVRSIEFCGTWCM